MFSVTPCFTLTYTHSHLAHAQDSQSFTIGQFTALQTEFWGGMLCSCSFQQQLHVGCFSFAIPHFSSSFLHIQILRFFFFFLRDLRELWIALKCVHATLWSVSTDAGYHSNLPVPYIVFSAAYSAATFVNMQLVHLWNKNSLPVCFSSVA